MPNKTISLNEIAKEVKITPRLARMKLREAGDKAPAKQHPYNWLFAKRDAPKVRKLLKKE